MTDIEFHKLLIPHSSSSKRVLDPNGRRALAIADPVDVYTTEAERRTSNPEHDYCGGDQDY